MRNWWAGLFGKGTVRRQASDSGEVSRLEKRPPPFTSYSNPFAGGSAERREAEALEKSRKKRTLLLSAGVLALLLSAGVGVGLWTQANAAKVARITAAEPVLSEEAGQLRLSAKLMSAPSGESVPMSCAWRSPDGALLQENAWQTKPVSHNAWETHCVLKSAPEHVKVAMMAHGRVVAESSR